MNTENLCNSCRNKEKCICKPLIEPIYVEIKLADGTILKTTSKNEEWCTFLPDWQRKDLINEIDKVGQIELEKSTAREIAKGLENFNLIDVDDHMDNEDETTNEFIRRYVRRVTLW